MLHNSSKLESWQEYNWHDRAIQKVLGDLATDFCIRVVVETRKLCVDDTWRVVSSASPIPDTTTTLGKDRGKLLGAPSGWLQVYGSILYGVTHGGTRKEIEEETVVPVAVEHHPADTGVSIRLSFCTAHVCPPRLALLLKGDMGSVAYDVTDNTENTHVQIKPENTAGNSAPPSTFRGAGLDEGTVRPEPKKNSDSLETF
jgi:hypothetical protein